MINITSFKRIMRARTDKEGLIMTSSVNLRWWRMRILLDTNIFIDREQDHVLSRELAKLLQTLNKLRAELVIHPLSVSELRRDSNIKRREVNLSKIEAYSHLERPPNPNNDTSFCESIGPAKNSHDVVDMLSYTPYTEMQLSFSSLKIEKFTKRRTQ